MKIARTARLFLCLMLLALLPPVTGCDSDGLKDWLSPSGSAGRSSPVISGLAVSRTSFFCGEDNKATISFSYSDPQDDIFLVIVSLENVEADQRFEVTVPWFEMDLTRAGTASFHDFFFPCGPATGSWTMTVKVEDERGHLSNELTTDVTLVSSR